MRRIDTLRRAPVAHESRDQWPGLSLQEYMNFLGRRYLIGGSYGQDPTADFVSYVRQVGERNGVVAAAVTARALLISQTRFIWRRTNVSTNAGSTFGDRSLSVLERPGSMTRPELLFLAEEDASYAGNFYAYRKANVLHRLRPDWITVVLGSDEGPVDDWVPPDATIIGYIYKDPTKRSGRMDSFAPAEIVHWKPEPHPLEWWRGQSWVTSVLREIRNDGQATEHTSKFFEHAGTPNLIFTMDPSLDQEQVSQFAELANQQTAGTENAYKNLYLGGGASVQVVGSKEAAIGTRDIQGGYETRIASRSRVPAVVLGIREGMQGSALNAGNYSQTRRLWSDGWYSPTTQNLAAAFEAVVPPPSDAELWPDPSDVMFLQEDMKDAASIAQTNSQAVRALVEAGYDPDAAVEAVTTGDYTKLRGNHTGVFSVQLQPPDSGQSEPA